MTAPNPDSKWAPPRCGHGAIILGCPRSDCAEQNAYLNRQEAAVAAMYQRQEDDARSIVRAMLGLPAQIDGGAA